MGRRSVRGGGGSSFSSTTILAWVSSHHEGPGIALPQSCHKISADGAKHAASSSAQLESGLLMQCSVGIGVASPSRNLWKNASEYGPAEGISAPQTTANLSGTPIPRTERAAMIAASVAPCSWPIMPAACLPPLTCCLEQSSFQSYLNIQRGYGSRRSPSQI